jgi:hypothetical protein
LRLHDHDLAAEEVLVALGGEPCACLVVRDAFRNRVEPPAPPSPPRGPMRALNQPVFQSGGLIVRASNPVVSVRPTTGWRVTSSIAALSTGPQVRPGDAVRLLQSLNTNPSFLHMPPEARERLLAHLRYQVVQEIAPGALADLIRDIGQLRMRRGRERESRPTPRPELDRILHQGAESAIRETVRRSRADLRAYGTLTVECTRLHAGEPAHIDGRVSKFGGFVNIRLPSHWLNRIWLRGLAEVEGYLVLEVDQPAPATHLLARAVRWHRRSGGDSIPQVADCIITRQASIWRLTWCS